MKFFSGICLLTFSLVTASQAFAGCPSTFSQRAVRVAGTDPWYPNVCKLTACRPMGFIRQIYGTTEDCNPVTGCHPVTYLRAKYTVQLGETPTNSCPADVSASPWSKP